MLLWVHSREDYLIINPFLPLERHVVSLAKSSPTAYGVLCNLLLEFRLLTDSYTQHSSEMQLFWNANLFLGLLMEANCTRHTVKGITVTQMPSQGAEAGSYRPLAHWVRGYWTNKST